MTASSSQTSRQTGQICILMATRGRPEMVSEVFGSLQKRTADKSRVRFRIYVDDDDLATREAIQKNIFPDPGFPVLWHISSQTPGLGETHQVLWKADEGKADIYMITVDDARFDTSGWDEILRAEFARYPDGILLAFPHDPMTADAATYPIMGAGWLEITRRIFPGYFPYWFDDKWVNQIGQLIGRCVKCPVVLYPIRGKGRTKRMRNLPFWTRFFQVTLEERKETARKLIAGMHPGDEAKRNAALARMEETAKEFEREKESFSDAYCVFQEERHTEMSPEERLKFDAKTFKHEAAIVARLVSEAENYFVRKDFTRAMDLLDTIQLSDIRVRHAHTLMAECLKAAGRSEEAERVRLEDLAAWPRMNGLRSVFRFLGMVANDGKRMLVGVFQRGNKK